MLAFSLRFRAAAARRLCRFVHKSTQVTIKPYDPACENQMNVQIGHELSASLTYLALAAFCTRPCVALPGMAGFCLLQSEDERAHATNLMAIQMLRGGTVKIPAVVVTVDMSSWTSLKDVLTGALSLEQCNMSNLLNLHQVAATAGEDYVTDCILSHFIADQYKEIHTLDTLLSQLRLAGNCAEDAEHCVSGAYHVDQTIGLKYPYTGPISLTSY